MYRIQYQSTQLIKYIDVNELDLYQKAILSYTGSGEFLITIDFNNKYILVGLGIVDYVASFESHVNRIKDGLLNDKTHSESWLDSNDHVPANSVCPFRIICTMRKSCRHTGIDQLYPYSCSTARAYNLHKDKLLK